MRMRRVRPSTAVAANRLENWDRMGYDANLEIRTATAELLEKKVPFLPSFRTSARPDLLSSRVRPGAGGSPRCAEAMGRREG